MFDWSRVCLWSAQRLHTVINLWTRWNQIIGLNYSPVVFMFGLSSDRKDELSELVGGQRCIYTCCKQPQLKVEDLLYICDN